MLKTRQCMLCVRTFFGVTSKIWSFFLYILRKHLRTVIISPSVSLSRNYHKIL
uniref:Uncharacterized protein n=1 Tax=Astyanax mexicanus TaxID=7994 RepID=A0A8B9GWL4_ASTMX